MNITFIIPIVSGFDTTLLKRAVDSILNCNNFNDNTITIVGDKKALSEVDIVNDSVVLLENPNDTDFASQVNHAVSKIDTKFFSVVEFDDVVDVHFVDEFNKYRTHYTASVYLQLNELVNTKNEFKGFGNEICWSPSFSDEIGYLDYDSLKNYVNFFVSGSVIDTEEFNDLGGLKSEYDILSFYEFLLRVCVDCGGIFTIPKVVYTHTIDRENSLSHLWTGKNEEIEGLINKALEENPNEEESEE